MELWNDYEGKTVDGRYRLDRLLGPKGRSALFVTTDETGEPALIRLIESLNDEGEILGRWRAVRDLRQENLSRVLACDQTVLDGVHLVYAVLEPFDAELAEILKERPLSADEAKEVAGSVAAALEALHAGGLVHEHVEPAYVVARGEVVKLRSDLVREAGDGADGAAMRKRDAHDLAVLIGETMTRRREPGGTPLPAPLDELVRNGRSGAWGVSEMAAVLRPAPGPWAAVTAPGSAKNGAGDARAGAGPGARSGSGSGAGPGGGSASGAVAAAGAVAVADQPPAPARAATPGRAVFSEAASRAGAETAGTTASAPRSASVAEAKTGGQPDRSRVPLVRDRFPAEPEEEVPHRKGLWAIAAIGLVVAILLFWHFLHAGRPVAGEAPVQTPVATTTAAAVPAPAPVASDVPVNGVRSTKPSAARTGRERVAAGAAAAGAGARKAAAATSPDVSAGADTAAGGGATGLVGTAASPHDPRSDWRVVAFTYNREDQAQHKVATIAQQHPELRPEVFAPKGGSPFLVALGGWMSGAEAAALREKARSEGLPHDTYVQNFRAH